MLSLRKSVALETKSPSRRSGTQADEVSNPRWLGLDQKSWDERNRVSAVLHRLLLKFHPLSFNTFDSDVEFSSGISSYFWLSSTMSSFHSLSYLNPVNHCEQRSCRLMTRTKARSQAQTKRSRMRCRKDFEGWMPTGWPRTLIMNSVEEDAFDDLPHERFRGRSSGSWGHSMVIPFVQWLNAMQAGSPRVRSREKSWASHPLSWIQFEKGIKCDPVLGFPWSLHLHLTLDTLYHLWPRSIRSANQNFTQLFQLHLVCVFFSQKKIFKDKSSTLSPVSIYNK